MMNTPYTVGIRKRQVGAEDAHGNSVDSWADPVNIDAYSIAPTVSNEPFEAGRNAVITGLTVLAPMPKTLTVEPQDRAVVNGEEYTVEGEVGNWNQGPFDFEPGIEIRLERVEG